MTTPIANTCGPTREDTTKGIILTALDAPRGGHKAPHLGRSALLRGRIRPPPEVLGGPYERSASASSRRRPVRPTAMPPLSSNPRATASGMVVSEPVRGSVAPGTAATGSAAGSPAGRPGVTV